MNRQNKHSRLWRTGSISGGILLLILSGVLLISAEETDPADRRNMGEQEYTGNEPDNRRKQMKRRYRCRFHRYSVLNRTDRTAGM